MQDVALDRMKSLGLEHNIILDYYVKEIRPVVEHGVPVWNSGLTVQQISSLERVQKVALKIILRYLQYVQGSLQKVLT